MIVSIVKSITGAVGKLARFTGSGRMAEKFENRPMYQHYGFASRPKEGAKAIALRSGDVIVIIADDDSRYRIALQDGEAAIYSDEGDKVHLKRNHEILIQTTGKCVVDAGSIHLGSEALAALGGGVVTVMCSCAYTGALHPVGSQSVKAKL